MSDLMGWLRSCVAGYEFDVSALLRRRGRMELPASITSFDELEASLDQGGHLLPLPTESAALANIVEVTMVDHILAAADLVEGISAERGTERGYPDLEFGGPLFGGGYHAVDVKVARRRKSGRTTQSRITLYTGNTYFRYPHEERETNRAEKRREMFAKIQAGMEAMPDDFPPVVLFNNVAAIRETTEGILHLLEENRTNAEGSASSTS